MALKFGLAGFGSRGDVEPLAAVGRELSRRGHEVGVAVTANMVDFVEAAGLTVVAHGSDPEVLREQVARDNQVETPISAMIGAMQHLNLLMAEWGEALTTVANGADLVLTGTSEQGLAANLAEHQGIPAVALHFYPGAESGLGGLLGDVAKEAEANQRRALGLPEGVQAAPSLEIQAYDALCFPDAATERADHGPGRPFVGTMTLEAPTRADDEVLSWIEAGTPPIYFGFGSMPVPSPAETVAVLNAACEQVGERGLVCSGPNDFTGVPHFDRLKVVEAVNHGTVFPACRALVHHGGAGTTAAGLRAGIPTLILWFSVDDQPVWADAVTRLKVGRGQEFFAATLDSLVADLRVILTPEYAARAAEVAAEMTKPADSVARVADLLEESARRGRSS